MKYFFLLLFFIFNSFCVVAQKKQLDSLHNLLKNYEKKTNYESDTNYINTLSELTLKYQSVNPDSMIILGIQAVELCQKINYDKGLSEANRNIGVAYWVKSDYTQSLQYYQKAIEIASKLNYQKEVGRLYYNIAKVYDNQGKYPEALESHFKALKISEDLGDKKGVASSWNNIGNIYRNQNKYAEALENYQKGLDISKGINNKKGIAYSMEGMAGIFDRQKNYEKALEYYLISIKTEQELGDKRGIAYCLDGLGSIYIKQEKHTEALKHYQEALEINRELGDKAGIARILQGLGETHLALKQYDLAIKYLKEGADIAQKIGHKERIRNCNGFLSEIYEAMGQHTQALFHHKLFKLYADSLNNKETEKKTANLAAQYEYERKENLLKAEHERQSMQFRWVIILVLVGLVSVLIIAFFVFRSHKKIKRAYEKVALVNAEILQKNEEIEQQSEHLRMANNEISIKNEQVEKALNNIEVISEIGQKVTASLNLQKVVQLVYESVNALMDAGCFGIGIYLPNNQQLIFEGFIEKGGVLPTIQLTVSPNDLTLATICLLEQREILINNIYADAKEYGIDIKPQAGELATSLIYLPLIIENRTVGVITVQSFQTNRYGETEMNILKALASYISIAIENSHSYGIIDKKNKHITDSIRYALTIQQAMLPHETNLQTALKEYFVIYKPKDMVSGDFYWLSNKKDAIFVAVVDCTGHGVPGAFMSMIGISLLHEAINQQNIFEPAQVLQHINSEIRYALKQDETSNRDGMDLVLCKIEKQANNLNQITFSGAKRPLFYSQNGKICEIKGTRKNIGGNQKQLNNFEQHEFNLSNGEMLYLTTDGYADQANNNRENFGTQQLIILLEKINNKPTNEQQKILLQNLQEHQQQTDQRDDITVMGIRL